jgi:hypothetical protein
MTAPIKKHIKLRRKEISTIEWKGKNTMLNSKILTKVEPLLI